MNNKKVIMAFVAVCFFWGSTYLAIKIGIRYFPPLLFSGTRFLVAGALMLLFARFKKLRMPKTIVEILPIAIVGCLMLTGGNGLVTLAEVTIDSGIASLFIAMVPIYIAVIEVILIKNTRLTWTGYLGLCLGFVGVYFLINPQGSALNFGALMLLMAGLLWSIGSVLSKKIPKNIHIIPSIGIQMLSGGILMLVLGALKHEQPIFDVSYMGYLSFVYLVVFGSIVGYSCYIYVLSIWPASKAGTYAYVNPVVALVLGYVILHEPINKLMVVSMLLILISVYIVQKSKIRQK